MGLGFGRNCIGFMSGVSGLVLCFAFRAFYKICFCELEGLAFRLEGMGFRFEVS